MSIYDCSEAVLGYLRLHPYFTVLALEPIVFFIAIYRGLYGLKKQSCLQAPFNFKYWMRCLESLLLCLESGFLILFGLTAACVAAKGQDAQIAVLFAFIPFGCSGFACWKIIRWRHKRSISDYVWNI